MPPRRITRSSQAATEGKAEEVHAPPLPVVKSTATRRVRGVKGKLQDLPNMPWDVIFEIFSHLHPFDLLRLARTSKGLRAFLMHRNSKPCWKQAFKNLEGLPECPDDLCEPKYANLLFSNHCDFCLKAVRAGQNIDWAGREHTCKQCAFSYSSFWDISGGPSVTSSTMSKEVIFRNMMSVPVTGFEGLTVMDKAQRAFSAADCISFIQRLSALEPEKREEFMLAAVTRCGALYLHAAQCEHWCEIARRAKGVQSSTLRDSRRNSIKQKLRDLGWGEELDDMIPAIQERFTRHAFVNQPKELTERAWTQGQPAMIALMEEHKVMRLERLLSSAIRSRCETLAALVFEMQPLQGIFPSTRDFAFLPEFRTIIDVAYDVQVPQDSFEPLKPRMLEYASTWGAEVKTKMQDTFNKELDTLPIDLSDDIDPFELAIGACWWCKKCRTYLSFLDVLAHKCSASTFVKDDLYRTAVQAHPDRSLYADTLHSLAGPAYRVIAAVGQDPARVTVAEMDALPARFVCVCELARGQRRIMTWRMAVAHPRDHRTSMQDKDTPLVLATPRELEICKTKNLEAAAQRIADAEFEGTTAYWPWRWYCPACRSDPLDTLFRNVGEVVAHMRERHGLQDPDEEKLRQARRCGPNAKSYQPGPVYLVSKKGAGRKEIKKLRPQGIVHVMAEADADLFPPSERVRR